MSDSDLRRALGDSFVVSNSVGHPDPAERRYRLVFSFNSLEALQRAHRAYVDPQPAGIEELPDVGGHMADAVRDAAAAVLGRVVAFEDSRDIAAQILAHLTKLSGATPKVEPSPPWRPISTAKRNDTRILLCRPGVKPFIGFWSNWNRHWTDGTVDSSRDHIPCCIPTHWMPIPEAVQ